MFSPLDKFILQLHICLPNTLFLRIQNFYNRTELSERTCSFRASFSPVAYLGLSQKCKSRRCSRTSLTNHSSGRTASPMGWRASAGSQGQVWWQHFLHSSKDNSGEQKKKRMVLCNKFITTKIYHLLSVFRVLEPTGRKERWWPSTVRRAMAAVTYICVSWTGAILAWALSLRLTALRDKDKAHKPLRWGSFPTERHRDRKTKLKAAQTESRTGYLITVQSLIWLGCTWLVMVLKHMQGTDGGTRTTFCGQHLPVSCSWLSWW